MMKGGPILITAAITAAMWGCAKEEKPANDDSDKLYRGCLAVSRQYADSIRLASDSAAAEEAFNRAGELLDSVNFSVAPDTDLLLTEEENDTLYANITLLRTLLKEKLHNLSLPDTLRTPLD